MTAVSVVTDWTKLQRELLSLERESERTQLTDKIESLSAKQCEDAGLSLLSMTIESSSHALFGRCCLSLKRSDGKILLKSLKVGDEIVMYCPKLRGTSEFLVVEGIVSKSLPASLEIVCDEIDESLFDSSIRIDLRANDGTYKKYLAVLDDLDASSLPMVSLLFPGEGLGNGPLSVSLRCSDCAPQHQLTPKQVEHINPNLNISQKTAVLRSLEMNRVSVIHGPPGTGKTSTVIELIHQSALLGRSVLVCAPSNVAVDNVLERLIIANESVLGKGKGCGGGGSGGGGGGGGLRGKLKLVRLGHPARVSQRGARYCLDALIASDDGTDIVSDVRAEIDGLRKEILKCKKRDRNRRREIQNEVRVLSKEVRKREDAVVKGIMKGADVVVCTCVTAGSRLLRDILFDVLIIDEAAQALEVSCWIPMLSAKSCVLVGDHNQLPPTVKSAAAASRGLGTTLFERVIESKVFQREGLVHLLDTQYRMNSKICDWTSKHIYEGKLLSHPSVAVRTINDIGDRASRIGVGTGVTSVSEIEAKTLSSVGAVGRLSSTQLSTLLSPLTSPTPLTSLSSLTSLTLEGITMKICEPSAELSHPSQPSVEKSQPIVASNESNEPNDYHESHECNESHEYKGAFPVLLLLDTAGSEMYEDACGEGSRSNYGEAQVVLQHVLYLLDIMEVQPGDIGVITPYNGQLGVLRQLFATHGETDPRLSLVDMKTIDGYQGGEKECVVLSLVRSSLKQEVGFLGDKRRINVAVTRARVHLAVVCDVDTCSSDPFISVLLDHMSAVGVHNSVYEVSYLACCLSEGGYSSNSTVAVSRETVRGKKDHNAGFKAAAPRQDVGVKSKRAVGGSQNIPSHSNVPRPVGAVDYPIELERLVNAFASGGIVLEDGVTEVICPSQCAPGVAGIAVLKVLPVSKRNNGKDAGKVDGKENENDDGNNGKNNMENDSEPLAAQPCNLLRFPSSLDSYCRLLVHELATTRSLFHRSVGVGPDRCIEISIVPFIDISLSSSVPSSQPSFKSSSLPYPPSLSPSIPPSIPSSRPFPPPFEGRVVDLEGEMEEAEVEGEAEEETEDEVELEKEIQGEIERGEGVAVARQSPVTDTAVFVAAAVDGIDGRKKGDTEGDKERGNEEKERGTDRDMEMEEIRRIRAAKFSLSKAPPAKTPSSRKKKEKDEKKKKDGRDEKIQKEVEKEKRKEDDRKDDKEDNGQKDNRADDRKRENNDDKKDDKDKKDDWKNDVKEKYEKKELENEKKKRDEKKVKKEEKKEEKKRKEKGLPASIVKDEDTSLEEAIRENQMRARNLQYRVGSTPFPNPNSVDNNRKAHLRKIITEAEALRKTATQAAIARK